MSTSLGFKVVIITVTFFSSLFSLSTFARPQIEISYARPLSSHGPVVLRDGHELAIIKLVLGKPYLKKSNAHKKAYEALVQSADFFEQQFGLKSYDGKNSGIKATVGVGRIALMFPTLKKLKQNAVWATQEERFIFGAGGEFMTGFEDELDVVAHEYTHAVIQHSSQIPMWGESGALGEHFADLFGEIAEQLSRPTEKKWLIGEDILTPTAKKNYSDLESRPIEALRDMLNPGDGFERQPSHYSQVPFEYRGDCVPARENDACGVHVMNGIPNRAAALIITQLGWEKVKWIYFKLMTERLKTSYLGHEPKFADYSRELLQLCSETLESQDCDVVLAALQDVGLR